MNSCDVLIVGGGPAGSTCAGKLREAGLDVMLLDKETYPRHQEVLKLLNFRRRN